MASSQITWGDLLVAKNAGKEIKEGAAIDGEGNLTTDPGKAMEGGLLPFFGRKGSGLAFIVELLGGALTGSRVGNNVAGGWGSFYILIDPTLFRPLKISGQYEKLNDFLVNNRQS
jgi:L-2-hydroxycarboxylate dehydrogenase (NAD+)